MITAKEAKHQSLVNSELKEHLRMIESRILKEITEGGTCVTICVYNPIRGELKNALLKELNNLGYKAEYELAKPSSLYDVDRLYISWAEA